MIPFVLTLFLGLASAAKFGFYHDAACSQPITQAVAFTDVCTWTSNQYSGSQAIYLRQCETDSLEVVVYNASFFPTCNGVPLGTLPVTSDCVDKGGYYVKGDDFSCTSENSTYNIVAHFTSDCSDGGVPFSIQFGQQTDCNGDAFAPGFFGWDVRGSYSPPDYRLEVFNTTNGTCRNPVSIFTTQEFPATCVKPARRFEISAIDMYNAFPVNMTI